MRPIVYIVLLAIAFLVFKAFFLDAYLAERKAAEANATTAEEQSHQFSKSVPVLKTKGVYSGEQNVSIEKPKPSYSEMPLEKVGDKIAEKIGGHLQD